MFARQIDTNVCREEKSHLRRTNNQLVDRLKLLWIKYKELMPTFAHNEHMVLTPTSVSLDAQLYNIFNNSDTIAQTEPQQYEVITK